MLYSIHFSYKKEKQKSVDMDIANNDGNDREEKEQA